MSKSLKDLDPDARTLLRFIVEMGYGYDFTGGPAFPEHLRWALAEAHHADQRPKDESVEDYYWILAWGLGWEMGEKEEG